VSPRSYGISPRRRNLMIGLWLIMTMPLALPGLLLSEPGLLVSAVLITAIMLPIFLLAIRAARLDLTDEGIELRQLGWRVSTSWENIAGIRMVRGREGLILHAPLADKGAERLAAAAGVRFRGASLYDAEQERLIAEQRFIPLEPFAYWFEHGDLGATLAARLPLLSGPEAFAPVDAPKLPPQRVALIAAIIVAALAAGIVLAFASPETQWRVERILAVPLAAAMAVYACANSVAAVRHLRAGRYGWFLLWAAMALVQLLVVLAICGAAL
jgi:hypothetical protein